MNSGSRMPRELSRRFHCPRCKAGPNEPCRGNKGQSRESSHQARIDAARRVMARSRGERVDDQQP